jgi:tellurite resistance protein
MIRVRSAASRIMTVVMAACLIESGIESGHAPEWRNGRRRGLKSTEDVAAGQRVLDLPPFFFSEDSEE